MKISANPNAPGPLNKPFPNGAKCPVCRGLGKLNESRDTVVLGTISKSLTPQEFQQLQSEIGRIPKNVAKLRTKHNTIQDIREAKTVTIDGIVYEKLSHQITQGLGDLQFVKSFWEQRSSKHG